MAVRAERVAAVAREQHADMHLVGLCFQPLEKVADTVPLMIPVARPVRIALKDPPPVFGRELFKRHIERDAGFLRVALKILLALGKGRSAPGFHAVLRDAEPRVRNDEPEIHPDHAAEPVAGVTGAKRRIEAEGRRVGVGETDAAVRAGESPGVFPGVRLFAFIIQRVHRD